MGIVYFIGAGPGDPELLTIKAARIIAEAGLVLYAGSLVPTGVVAHARPEAKVIDSSGLTLEQTHALLVEAVNAGKSAARVHTGDPALYGAVREQALLLDRDGIAWEVVPGVSAAFAAAAEARVSFTVPEVTQTLVITRLAGRTPVPESEALAGLATHGAAMAVYLSAADAPRLRDELLAGGYAPETTVVVGHKVGWPGGETLRTTLADMAEAVRAANIGRQAVFLVLPGESAGEARSKLYDPQFAHGYRNGGR
ncbi:precorrin-4 C(11)-methyltransferase [Desulfocurvibacter africanus]|uniref:precorrin-4 C(11)-methyltransferase n=1 Tax=Desulfocurvibacter africanus TaxID=873 RepID=UPI000416C654|nr:precorrin-4 C(11)-methyltransferase [Desulfocurvibacter africanus]